MLERFFHFFYLKKTKFISLFFAFTLFVNFSLNSQINNKFLSKYVSRNWNSSNGLPGNTITDIMQDSKGYIYFGTYEGLVRFDGFDFLTINKNYSKKLNFVSARIIFQDSKDNFWIGSNDEGITCVTKNEEVKVFRKENGLPNNSIRAVSEDKNGNIWVGTASGLICISSDFKLFLPKGLAELPRISDSIIMKIYCDTEGRVWTLTSENGAFYYDFSQERFIAYKNFKSKDVQITTINQDSKGDYWFGIAPHHVIKKSDINSLDEDLYDLGFGKQQGTMVNCIFEDSKKNIWFSLDYGLSILDANDGNIYGLDKEDGIIDLKITKIIEDREGNIWIATDKGGVQKLSNSRFKTVFMQKTINAIAKDDYRNCTWLAADDGIYCYQNGVFIQNEITEYCKNVRVRFIEITDDKKILLSTYEKFGFIEFTFENNEIQETKIWRKENGLAGNKVRVSLKTKNGDIYVGTTSGLSIIKKNGDVINLDKKTRIKNDYIMSLYEADDGRVWCGTDGGGIFILKNYSFDEEYTTEKGLAGNVIFKIEKVRKNEIWITTGAGLTIFENGEFRKYNSSNGLGTDSVFQAIYGNDGNIWLTSNRGIFSVNEKEFDKELGKNEKIVSKFYDKADGILSGGVNATSLSMIDSNNSIWFTLIDGFVIREAFDKEVKINPPISHIEEVIVGTEKIQFDGNNIIIPPNASRIVIKFSGLSYEAPEHVQFQTKLEGFDTDYTAWANDRTVSYTNLSPKTYKFTVRAKNYYDVFSESDEILTIVKLPQFHQTIWFWVLIVLLILFAGLTIVRIRTAKYKREKALVQRTLVEFSTALASTIEMKDKYTTGHSQRVAKYSKMLANALGKDESYQDQVFYIGIIHDIGKLLVPTEIIQKQGPLTDEEFAEMKRHPIHGYEILKSIKSMKEIIFGARWHHERFDGKGYPDGLKGTDIPEIARIIAVADAYDAMTSNRSYRKHLPQDAVREQIVKGRGTQFDPIIADKMIEIIDNDKNYELKEN